MLRVVLIDLLVERPTFGHQGNLQIISPLLEYDSVEVWLLTPQMQDGGVGDSVPRPLSPEEVPLWHGDFDFANQMTLIPSKEGDNSVHLLRMATPHPNEISAWLQAANPAAVYCTGSRSNVSQWEDWMDSVAELLRASINAEIPTLGICFGHQILCRALGSEIERAPTRSDMVVEIPLSGFGSIDPLFAGIDSLRGLFTHQDHVTSIPENCVVLAQAEHSPIAAVRVCEDKRLLNAYGVQFHPEAYPELIQDSYEAGYLSLEESNAVHGEHDGWQVLTNFASVVHSQITH